MPGIVFISCGQANDKERQVAESIRRWFRKRGFEPYVAIHAQSLADVNSGIIRELKRSDFYVFIDFRREKLSVGRTGGSRRAKPVYRGSLFTNQELGIAHFLGFDKVVFLQQKGVVLEGLLRYMGSNAATFRSISEVPAIVEKLVEERGWTPVYSRHLVVGDSHWTPELNYHDHTGGKRVRVFELDIHNRRNDLAALSAVARLRRLRLPDGSTQTDLDTSPLKAVGQYGFVHTIWPERHVAWDLFAVHTEELSTVSLNSALDVIPRRPLISVPGDYLLTYEIFAVNFPVLTLDLQLSVNTDPIATSVSLEPVK